MSTPKGEQNPQSSKHKQESLTLSKAQIEAMAIGLYYIANVDGIDAREQDAIQEFLQETDQVEFWQQLAQKSFDPEQLAKELNTEWLRGIFLKSAIYLVQADGKVSPTETEALSWIASYLQVSTPLEELETQVRKETTNAKQANST